MDEADVRLKIQHCLRDSYGYWDITQTDAFRCEECGHVTRPPKGRPDVLFLHPIYRPLVMEAKALRAGETSFPFAKITQDQREWLDRWKEDGGFGYIGLGVIRQAGSRHKLDGLYLVDWHIWQMLEELAPGGRKSIPLKGKVEVTLPDMLGGWSVLYNIRDTLAHYEIRKVEGKWVLPAGSSAIP